MIPIPNTKWSHLWCDPGEVDKLHEFAKKLGLKREWFQNKKNFPHYDVTAGLYYKALKLGAVEKELKPYIQENYHLFLDCLKDKKNE